MVDVALSWNNEVGCGDWVLLNGDVVQGDDLLSSVMLQLFTDKSCSDDFIPLDGDRRGWWGSYYEDTPIGSRLWQLDRAKFAANHNILLMARDYTQEAMQPFIDQGIASKIIVNVAKINIYAIGISIVMYKPTAPTPVTFQFGYVWNQLSS